MSSESYARGFVKAAMSSGVNPVALAELAAGAGPAGGRIQESIDWAKSQGNKHMLEGLEWAKSHPEGTLWMNRDMMPPGAKADFDANMYKNWYDYINPIKPIMAGSARVGIPSKEVPDYIDEYKDGYPTQDTQINDMPFWARWPARLLRKIGLGPIEPAAREEMYRRDGWTERNGYLYPPAKPKALNPPKVQPSR